MIESRPRIDEPVVRGVIVESKTGWNQANRGALGKRADNARQARGIGPPHVAIAQSRNERRQRAQHLQDIDGLRRPSRKQSYQSTDCWLQIRQQHGLHEVGSLREVNERIPRSIARALAASASVLP